ncbi:CHAD domain-containing protein [Moraxellaceae bacterium AER2_44_116]|nr:CHAD domain-containing protein [Moraxellaceae bacterium]TQC96011.1 CHAD domain-containing protein [Moraxellaceae bacterium AER2_44_116]
MSSIYPLLSREIHRLHGQFVDCQSQLTQLAEHPEALHDLRVSLRQLRSLLRPLRHFPEIAAFDAVLSKVISQSNRVRDMEVLVAELQAKQQATLYQHYQLQLTSFYSLLAAHIETDIELIIQRLMTLPLYWQHHSAVLPHKKLEKHVVRYCLHYQQQLKKHLKSKKTIDKHHLRLLVKKLRYALESYGQFLTLNPKLQIQLKKTQEAIGNWHDRSVWLELANHEEALQVLVTTWQTELQHHEHLADKQLGKLLRRLRE